jgi:integrase/recombinase XerD
LPTYSVDGLISAYLDHLTVERGVSKNTSSAYRRDLRRYAEFLSGQGVDDPTKIDPPLVARFAMSLREPAGDRPALAPASAARAVVAVRSLHRFAAEEGIVGDDPGRTVQPPKPPKRLPKALSLDQVNALLASVDPDTVLGLRDLALLEMLYGTGARISELTGLDVDDVTRLVESDSATAGLRLFGKGSKERIVPLGSYARIAIGNYLVRSRPALVAAGRGTPALFVNFRGGRLSRQSAWAVLKSAAERAGLHADVSPHTLRHSFATHLLDGGADVRVVQELLGHASVTTTQIYTLVTVDHLREVYLTSHPRAH